MALVGNHKSSLRPELFMLDSGTTSKITPKAQRVTNKQSCDVSILLGDNSKVMADAFGDRKVIWQSEPGPVRVSLSNTLIAEDMSSVYCRYPP